MPQPDTALKDLYEQIREQKGQSPQYKVFLEALKQANEKIDELHRTKRGVHPAVTKEDKRLLNALYRKIGETADKVMKNEIDEDLQDMVGKVANLASANYKIMKAYDPEKDPKSLPELLEDARTITLDTRGTQLKATIGGNLSKRQPLTFVDPSGKEISGVFTPKKVMNCWENLEKQFDKIAESAATEEGKGMIKEFLEKSNRYVNKLSKDHKYVKTLDHLNKICMKAMNNRRRRITGISLEDLFREVYEQQLQGREVEDVLGPNAMKLMAEALQAETYSVNLNGHTAKIKDGSRIDSRNSAMSAVADLLNMPKVIARSKPMKIIGQDGQEIEGTFMEEAHGMDVNNLPPEAAKYNAKSLENTDGMGFKSVADLQILDDICGNIDRHNGNMFYQFDKNGKFCGVQGVDNDADFGTMVPKEDKGIHMLVGPENMKAVSESTYIAVQKLEPRTLRFVLRGYGLSDEELDAAEERLENLKFQLHKGYQQHCLDHQAGNANTPKFKRKSIAILKDNEWKDLSKQDVEALISGNNYFSRAVIEVKEMKQTLGSQKKKYKKLASDVAIGGDNRAIDGGLGREQKRTKDLLDGMNRVTNRGFWHAHFGTSEAFEDMRAAAEEYQEYQKQLELRIKEANSPQRRNDPAYVDKGYVSANELMTLARLSKRVEETADVYLEKKGPEEEITNPYTRSRVQMAKLAKEFGKKGAVRSEEELETVRKNESRAVEKLGRTGNAQIEEIEKNNLIQGP